MQSLVSTAARRLSGSEAEHAMSVEQDVSGPSTDPRRTSEVEFGVTLWWRSSVQRKMMTVKRWEDLSAKAEGVRRWNR